MNPYEKISNYDYLSMDEKLAFSSVVHFLEKEKIIDCSTFTQYHFQIMNITGTYFIIIGHRNWRGQFMDDHRLRISIDNQIINVFIEHDHGMHTACAPIAPYEKFEARMGHIACVIREKFNIPVQPAT